MKSLNEDMQTFEDVKAFEIGVSLTKVRNKIGIMDCLESFWAAYNNQIREGPE